MFIDIILLIMLIAWAIAISGVVIKEIFFSSYVSMSYMWDGTLDQEEEDEG
jgi:hypothetical protein